jgi:zinc/manganese transport system substrate-binding protein
VVANGLGLEEGLLDSIEAAEADGVPVVELAEGLNPIEAGTGHSEEEKPAEEDGHSHSHEEEKPAEEDGHSHSHEGEDPHVWMDPDRVALAVPVIAEALASLDGLPVDAAQIDACAEDYVAELGALSGELDEQFAGLSAEQRRLVTSHEALGYLADRFDFEVIGAIIPSTSTLGESNVRDLEELASTMTDKGVTRIFGEVTGSDDVAAALAEQVGSQVEVVALYTESLGDEGSEAATYLGMMRANGSLIAG